MKFTSILRFLASASVALVLCAIVLSVVIFPTQAQTRAYVASSCNGQVSVIETRTNSVVQNIPAGN